MHSLKSTFNCGRSLVYIVLREMFIASASTTVKFHEFPNGNVVHHYQPGTKVEGPIRSISWSRDGSWLALVPFSGLVDVVSVKDQLKLIRTVDNIEEPTCAAFLNTTKKLVALGTKGGLVLIYDIKSKNAKSRFPRAVSSISHIDFTARDTHCVTGCLNGDIILYSNVTNSLSCTFRIPKSRSVTTLRANQLKRNLIIGGSNEGVVVVWDTNVNKAKFTMEAHKAPVTSVAFSPVNSDLVLSAGSDRQFCFYDIVDNKCIATVPVENSVTAVDFSPEGTYFVLGSQNGKLYIYDSRNIQEPVHSFSAHTSTVKHLLFQRPSDSRGDSISSISSDSVVPAKTPEEASNRNSDVFGMFIQIPSNEVVESIQTSGHSMEAGDSFIAALGLNSELTKESLHQENCASSEASNKWSEAKGTSPCINLTRTRQEVSSTPKSLHPKYLSPILAANQTERKTTPDEQAAIKDEIIEALKGSLEEIRADIKYQATHTTYQIKRMLLDMQMAMVREFMKVEDYCNSIREDIAAEYPRNTDNHYLLEENEQLKMRIECLEQQVAFLSASDKSEAGQSG